MATRKEQRAEWERNFRAMHGVSSGTYYSMRRKAESRGITAKQFEEFRKSTGTYREAKALTQTARSNPAYAKQLLAAAARGISPGTLARVAREGGSEAVAQVAGAGSSDEARFLALAHTGQTGDISFSDFDTEWDLVDIPDDFDWWYH